MEQIFGKKLLAKDLETASKYSERVGVCRSRVLRSFVCPSFVQSFDHDLFIKVFVFFSSRFFRGVCIVWSAA